MKRIFGKKRLEAMDITALILMTLITLCILIPFYNSIIISFSTVSAYLRNPFAFWPLEGTAENYTIVLKTGVIFTSYKNTILITVVGTVLSMSVSVAAAFVFSRKAFPGKRLFFLLMLFHDVLFRRHNSDLSGHQAAGTDRPPDDDHPDVRHLHLQHHRDEKRL